MKRIVRVSLINLELPFVYLVDQSLRPAASLVRVYESKFLDSIVHSDVSSYFYVLPIVSIFTQVPCLVVRETG